MDGVENKGAEIVIPVGKVKLAGVILVVLVAGVLFGSFFPVSVTGNAVLPTETVLNPEVVAGLSDEDKNFLLSVANSQVQLNTLQNDWCLSNGGLWNETRKGSELEINPKTADSLKQQGITVIEREGKFFANVLLVERNGCIFIGR